jgi:hypothetical protein
MQKRGKTAKGTQRWLCIGCTKSRSLGHETQKQDRLLDRFVAWLLGKQSQTELAVAEDITDRTWRTQTDWCWEIIPKPVLTGAVYSIILLDGIKVGSLVDLIARNTEAVILWHWDGWESSNTWEVLLKQLPAPIVVVCDGQKGILLAIARCWPRTRIQRCIFHVWQNIRVKLTLNPQTEAGQELLRLSKELLKGIPTKEQALDWVHRLELWREHYESFIRERTTIVDPQPRQRRWWYTHGRLRSAYYQLHKLVQDNQLFTYLDDELLEQTGQSIPRTTNYVEGGINSQIRALLKYHRGMNQTHQQRLADWYLYGRTKDQKPPRNFR